MTSRKSLQLTLITATLLLIGLILWRFQHQFFKLVELVSNRQELINAFQQQSPTDFVLFTGLLILMIWIPGAPYSVLAIISGICFGHWVGFSMNVLAATVGNFTAATILPKLTNPTENHPKKQLYRDLLKTKHPTVDILLGYAIPFVPSMVINLAAPQLIHSKSKLALVCFFGSLPTAALYAFGGDVTLRGDALGIGIVLLIAVILSGLLLVIRADRKKEGGPKAV